MAALHATAQPGPQVAQIAVHDGLVWAEVDARGHTLHFVLDTGAASSCVNLATARRLGLQLGKPLDVQGVDGRTTGYECTGFNATVGGMRLPQTVIAVDLSGPSRACSQRIDGLIGADFFQGKVVRIDYRRKLLSREATVRGKPAMRLRFADGAICVQVAVNGGGKRWTRLDTGCTDALDWCDGSCCGAKGTGKTVALAAWMGSVRPADVTVGTAELKCVPVTLRRRAIFSGEAGLLGNGVLSRYTVTIDGIGKRLVLE